GHVEAARVLIQNGAGVTEAAGNPIHYAGQRKHKDLCRLLVKHGAVDDLVESDDEDVVRLFRGAYSYDFESVNEVLERRPELVDSKDRNGRTALHEACTHGDTKTVRTLLRHGADWEIADANGQTPADRASDHGQRSVSKLLEKHRSGG
ncbi:MAG: ankyrin repeat domain-containing protein, partial [Planctomycetota bacterium]